MQPDKHRWEQYEMKSASLVTIATIAAMGFASVAQAQPNHEWHGHAQGAGAQQHQWQGHAQVQAQPQRQWQQHQWQQRQAPAYTQNYQAQRYAQAPRYVQRNYYGAQHYAAPQYRAYGGYAQHYAPRYYAGGYGPRYYTGGYYGGRRHWISDWGSYGLYAPPYGYGWVQTDTGDVLLIALATGLIANAILAQ
jgi:Ni/Co efflux regulator RcnB